MPELTFDAVGVGRVEAHLTGFRHRLEHPEPGFDNAADYLRGRMGRRFATRGDGSWRPNRPGTLRQKGGSQPLVDSGALLASFVRRGRGSVQRVSGSTMTYGTSLFYARFVGKRRRLFNTTATDRRQVSERFLHYLMGGWE